MYRELCFKKFFACALLLCAMVLSIYIVIYSVDSIEIDNAPLIETILYGMYGTALTLSGVKAIENIKIFKRDLTEGSQSTLTGSKGE